MADQSLQAFQLGASLFDRAQTQARIMEQMKQQTAESLLQQRGMQLQNQIRDITLAEALGEQEAQVAEFKAFSDLSKQVGDYLDNPSAEAKFPVVPAFKSSQYRKEADLMLNHLEKYSARAKLLRARDRADATSDGIAASTINKAIDLGALIRKPDGSWDIDVKVLNERSEELRKANLAKTTAQTTGVLGNLDVARGKLKGAADNLDRLTRENASKLELEKAKFEFKQALDTEEALLKEKRLELDRVSTLGNLDVARGKLQVAANNLDRLTREGASQLELEKAKFEFKQALDTEAALLNEKKFEFEKGVTTRKLDIEQEKADTAKAKAESGGKLPAPTKLDLDELEFSEAILNGIKPLEPYLSQDLFGPTFNIKVKAGEIFGGSLPEKTVNQFYENMRTGALFKRGGKALTKTEVERITSAIGKPTDVGFADRIDTFKEITARSIKDRVEKLKSQGITSNPQYAAYVNELERRANEILGVETESQSAAPIDQKPKRVRQGGKIYELDETTNAYVEVAQ